MSTLPDPSLARGVRRRCDTRAWAGPWSVCFAIAEVGHSGRTPTCSAWWTARSSPTLATRTSPGCAGGRLDKFLLPVPAASPPRHLRDALSRAGVRPFRVISSCHADAHVARRILEVGKWLALGHKPPVPLSLAPRAGRGGSQGPRWLCPVTVVLSPYQIYYETLGPP